jgi:hypothetical protein
MVMMKPQSVLVFPFVGQMVAPQALLAAKIAVMAKAKRYLKHAFILPPCIINFFDFGPRYGDVAIDDPRCEEHKVLIIKGIIGGH